eukprot:6209122-Pleurochrysis_carterae.AAC.3
MEDKQALCVDILVNGYVQAYVDFFYLTHRPDAQVVIGSDDQATDTSNGAVPADKLQITKFPPPLDLGLLLRLPRFADRIGVLALLIVPCPRPNANDRIRVFLSHFYLAQSCVCLPSSDHLSYMLNRCQPDLED